MRTTSFWLLALALGAPAAGYGQIQVVNITPASLSSETGIDSEPNLAVDPANPLRMAASAFTPDPMGGANAPIYVSTDGGSTWTLNSTLPGNDPTYGTGDITLRFGGTSGILYTGILVGGDFLHLNVLRASSFTAATPMEVLVDRLTVDQPYVQAATVMGGADFGKDRIYVGNNDRAPASPGKTATIDRTLDGATAPAPSGFSRFPIETRSTSGFDGPPIRPAIHADGTVYGIFYRYTSFTSGLQTADVVVIRTDDWGSGATPFTNLTDSSDTLSGRMVVTGRSVPAFPANIGQNRLVSSNLSIAVDPRTSSRVWIAWADRVGTTDYTLHVRRSDDRGVTWSASDLLTVTNATNPALAVNSKGRLGFLYQQLTGSAGSERWQTHFRRTDDGLAWSDVILADTPADTPVVGTGMYLGDYIHLQAVGKDFYGIFSAANTPVLANFPQGVTYQRNADWTAGTLLPASGPGTVAVSIDPFFFRATDIPADEDFYVRDWTASATSADTGLEPSTNPFFFVDSDVWNQLTNTVPTFNANDQPVASNVRNGLGSLGDNFAFARVHRKAAGPTTTVNVHFLYANFGIGLNYQNAGIVPDPTLTFPMGSTQETLTTGYPWHLDPTVSDHLCLAVEISTPVDGFIPPSLFGSSPGWPTTDLRVLNDNNKAQRNIHILPTGTATPGTGSAGAVSDYAIIHNAATFPRTITVRYEAEPEVVKKLGGARVEVVGERGNRPFRSGDVIRLENMQPGENRWLRVTFNAPAGREGEILPVHFREMVGNAAVNGFTLAARASSQEELLRHNLQRHHAVLTRMAALTGDRSAEEQSRAAGALLEQGGTDGEGYRAFLREHGRALDDSLKGARKDSRWKRGSICDWLRACLLRKTSVVSKAAAHHMDQLNELDTLLTVRQLAAGDPADILQNVRWQRDLYRAGKLTGAVVEKSDEFIARYSRREIGNDDYPGFVQGLLGSYRETAQALRSLELEKAAGEMAQNLGSPAALQKAHRSFLLALQDRLTGD